MEVHTSHEYDDFELEEREYVRSPLAEFGQALINIAAGEGVWAALAQATANIANHEGNSLRQRIRYERLCGFCDWMSGRQWRRLTIA